MRKLRYMPEKQSKFSYIELIVGSTPTFLNEKSQTKSGFFFFLKL